MLFPASRGSTPLSRTGFLVFIRACFRLKINNHVAIKVQRHFRKLAAKRRKKDRTQKRRRVEGTTNRQVVISLIGKLRISENRSEEHTSELQSRSDLVCRLLLEKKK